MFKFFTGILIIFSTSIIAQKDHPVFTKADSLRGSNTKERVWWDATHYQLDIAINIKDSTIQGSNRIQYKVIEPAQKMQIDLQAPLQITKVIQNNTQLEVTQYANTYIISLVETQIKNTSNELTIYYHGKPKTAVNAPWDGGFVWEKDTNNQPFIATACQGIGASLWWPNKDYLADEVDAMNINVNVHKDLKAIANGRLLKVESKEDDTKTFFWEVKNPINNYAVSINIGDYVSFSEQYLGEDGLLDCSYYVLKPDLEKAKQQFVEVPKMLKAFEYWFGPYPFYTDGYKLVQSPFLGMEHQSNIAYGNNFKNGYLGSDLSQTGWGLHFDFIIVHESGHEWFGNNMTNQDIADMWIHESFTTYAESLYLEYYYNKFIAANYIKGIRKRIVNDSPIIGHYGVNNEGSSDMYFKGANILHSLRQIVNDDKLWHQILLGLNQKFHHQTVTTQQIEAYISQQSGIDLEPFFNQYLRTTQIPVLAYYFKENKLYYKYQNTVSNFNYPIKIKLNGSLIWIKPNANWQMIKVSRKNQDIVVDDNFYCNLKIITTPNE